MSVVLCRLISEAGFLGLVVLMAALFFSIFKINLHGTLAEAHVDTRHWAGNSGDNWLMNFVYHAIRFNTGLGYTVQGRRIWWQGYRFAVVTYAAIIGAFVVTVWKDHQCS